VDWTENQKRKVVTDQEEEAEVEEDLAVVAVEIEDLAVTEETVKREETEKTEETVKKVLAVKEEAEAEEALEAVEAMAAEDVAVEAMVAATDLVVATEDMEIVVREAVTEDTEIVVKEAVTDMEIVVKVVTDLAVAQDMEIVVKAVMEAVDMAVVTVTIVAQEKIIVQEQKADVVASVAVIDPSELASIAREAHVAAHVEVMETQNKHKIKTPHNNKQQWS